MESRLMRTSTITLLAIAIFGVAMVRESSAQHLHHLHGHHQKSAPEAGRPPAPESGGFAAPSPSGTREGATGGVGINGPSIELPAMSLKLPTIRIPGLTRFTAPPHMRVKEAIAPLVAAARQEFSFESGNAPAPESGQPPAVPESGAPGQKEFQKSFQKASYDDCPECQRELQQLAKVHVDNSLEQRLAVLESSIGRLVDGLEAAQANTVRHRQENNYLQPFPAINPPNEFPVSRSSFEQIEQLPPRPSPTRIRRLPSVYSR